MMSPTMVPILAPVGAADPVDRSGRDVGGGDDPGADGVVDIVIDVGHQIRQPDDLRLEGRRGCDDRPETLGVGADSIDHLEGEVQPPAVELETLDHAHALIDVGEAARQDRVQTFLAGVTERGVSQVVREGNGLRQIGVEAQGARHRSGDLRDLQAVGQPGAEVVALRRHEDLGLLLEAPEGVGMDDPVAVALVISAQRTGRLGQDAAPACGRMGVRAGAAPHSRSPRSAREWSPPRLSDLHEFIGPLAQADLFGVIQLDTPVDLRGGGAELVRPGPEKRGLVRERMPRLLVHEVDRGLVDGDRVGRGEDADIGISGVSAKG